ncbi:LacI family transcriptional regulator [Protaetiibacter larvae]|uniref:LacI family transcriptional regulator n=2 Tax=Protaetiibacter larvae TaxID=2592654 RepID=A0A5C1YDJ5_9MICO|nr:LacI family transcriptional regulator [Protaetiibacter larvae]
MYDVAALAGVSHITVSRVLNDHPSLRPETRERVLAAIRQLGYRPNLAARALVTSRTGSIGVLTPEVAQHGPASLVLAVEQAARERGYHPLVTAAAVEHEAVVDALEFLLDQAVESLIVIAPHDTVLHAIEQHDIRVPLVTLQAPDRPDGVGVDQAEGARLATRHLLELGHRRVQHLSGPEGYLEAAARRRGFEEAMATAGVPTGAHLAGDWSAASGFAAAAELAENTTAVVAGNDQMAIGLIAALAKRGRRVPEEVSIVGFDDVPEAGFVLPALSTVQQDFAAVGRRAVATVASRLTAGSVGAEPAPDAVVAPRLVVRESTAPPRED